MKFKCISPRTFRTELNACSFVGQTFRREFKRLLIRFEHSIICCQSHIFEHLNTFYQFLNISWQTHKFLFLIPRMLFMSAMIVKTQFRFKPTLDFRLGQIVLFIAFIVGVKIYPRTLSFPPLGYICQKRMTVGFCRENTFAILFWPWNSLTIGENFCPFFFFVNWQNNPKYDICFYI